MVLRDGSISAISFDYGNVLGGLDLDEVAGRLMEGGRITAAERAGAAVEMRAHLAAAYARHDDAITDGRGHEQAWRALMGVLVSVGSRLGSHDESTLDDVVETLWNAQPTRNLWCHVPDEARALLGALRDRGVRMVVTSNSEGRIAELLAQVGIEGFFDAVFDSGRLGFGKPDRRIFDLAAGALDVSHERIVHIGDSEAADIVGAIGAGMQAIRFDGFLPAASGRPTVANAQARDFDELSRILHRALDQNRL